MSEEQMEGIREEGTMERGLQAWQDMMKKNAAAHLQNPVANQGETPIDPGKVFTENLPKMPGEGGAIV